MGGVEWIRLVQYMDRHLKELKLQTNVTYVRDVVTQQLLTRQTRVNYFWISSLCRCQILFHYDEYCHVAFCCLSKRIIPFLINTRTIH